MGVGYGVRRFATVVAVALVASLLPAAASVSGGDPHALLTDSGAGWWAQVAHQLNLARGLAGGDAAKPPLTDGPTPAVVDGTMATDLAVAADPVVRPVVVDDAVESTGDVVPVRVPVDLAEEQVSVIDTAPGEQDPFATVPVVDGRHAADLASVDRFDPETSVEVVDERVDCQIRGVTGLA